MYVVLLSLLCILRQNNLCYPHFRNPLTLIVAHVQKLVLKRYILKNQEFLLHLILFFNLNYMATLSCSHKNVIFVVDIDECLNDDYICAPTLDCLNIPGSYRCVVTCGPGFRRSADGRNCEGRASFTGGRGIIV